MGKRLCYFAQRTIGSLNRSRILMLRRPDKGRARVHAIIHTGPKSRPPGVCGFTICLPKMSMALLWLGMRQDDAELIVQLVKELPKFPRLSHSAPLEQICN